MFEPGYPLIIDEAKNISKERSERNDFYAVVLKSQNKMIGHIYFQKIQPLVLDLMYLKFIGLLHSAIRKMLLPGNL